MSELLTIDSPCPDCGAGNVHCRFNHFQRGALEIHAWEHKCLNCGLRETTAYRSDDEELTTPLDDRSTCPYCDRRFDPA
jgi:ssDNA-binding Zn-finger/Zn-ribbon topoisomerase 1